MKRLSIAAKVESLKNGLTTYKFPKKYFVHTADSRCGERFAIATTGKHGTLEVHSRYMTYDEFNAYLFGYYDAKMKKF